MSSLRPFHALDLFRFNLANLDVLTENYDPSFYLQYLAKWPTLCSVMESSRGQIMGYSMYFFFFPFFVFAFFFLLSPLPTYLTD